MSITLTGRTMRKIIRVVARHNTSRAVMAVVEQLRDGIKLRGVSPLDGVMPEVGHLVGQRFENLETMRKALIDAMRGPVGGTLNHVLLSRWAYDAWIDKISGVDQDAIPDEMVKPLPDYGLLIWVDLPSGRVELTVPKGHWAWRK